MKIYQIDSSARKDGSTSRALAKKLLDKIKPLTKAKIKKRKESLKKISEENLIEMFNYSTLSNKLKNLFESIQFK